MFLKVIHESEVKYKLFSEIVKFFFMHINVLFNLSKLRIFLSETNIFLSLIFSSHAIRMFIYRIIIFIKIFVDKTYYHFL